MGGATLLPPPPPPPRIPGECSHVIVISNLVSSAKEEHLRELCACFGKVQEVVLLPGDAVGGVSVRQALLSFALPGSGGGSSSGGGGGDAAALEGLKKLVDGVVGSMNSQDFGGVPMHLARAPFELVAAHLPALASVGPEPTCVVELREILVVDGVTRFEDAEEMEDLRQEIFQECSKSGVVDTLLIPTPSSGSAMGTAVPVYAAFNSVAGAVACSAAMKSKLFDGRLVATRFLTTEEWKNVQR